MTNCQLWRMSSLTHQVAEGCPDFWILPCWGLCVASLVTQHCSSSSILGTPNMVSIICYGWESSSSALQMRGWLFYLCEHCSLIDSLLFFVMSLTSVRLVQAAHLRDTKRCCGKCLDIYTHKYNLYNLISSSSVAFPSLNKVLPFPEHISCCLYSELTSRLSDSCLYMARTYT